MFKFLVAIFAVFSLSIATVIKFLLMRDILTQS